MCSVGFCLVFYDQCGVLIFLWFPNRCVYVDLFLVSYNHCVVSIFVWLLKYRVDLCLAS